MYCFCPSPLVVHGGDAHGRASQPPLPQEPILRQSMGYIYHWTGSMYVVAIAGFTTDFTKTRHELLTRFLMFLSVAFSTLD